MDRQYLNKIAPIIKDRPTWEAFLTILAYEESKIIAELKGPKTADELIRTNTKYNLIQHMKNLKEVCQNAEREFK